jgi:hypothetical protein
MLSEWINPVYLDEDYIESLQETLKSKPEMKYLVLDNFFKTDKLDARHETLTFSERQDMYSRDGEVLPYDGSVKFMNHRDYGYDILFSKEWEAYIRKLACIESNEKTHSTVKLRYHKPHAKGFWIHTDSTIRKLVFICYFNRNWKVSDGGLLQLWRVDESKDDNALKVRATTDEKMDFLNYNVRLNTDTPGGGLPDERSDVDFVLVDQIVPIYNRVFICNLEENPTYHSVTPSNERARTGFVQWLET